MSIIAHQYCFHSSLYHLETNLAFLSTDCTNIIFKSANAPMEGKYWNINYCVWYF